MGSKTEHAHCILAENKEHLLARYAVLSVFLITGLFTACSNKEKSNQWQRPDHRVHRFDHFLFTCDAPQVGRRLKDSAALYFPFVENGDSAFWFRQRSDSLLNALHRDLTLKEEAIRSALQSCRKVLGHWAFHFPGQTPTRLFTYISPLDFDYPLFLSDSLVFIALDQYLGPSSPFYAGQPSYLMRGRSMEFMALDLAEALAQRSLLAVSSQGSDLLSAMLHEGKVLYLTRLLSPEHKPHEVLRFTEDEWAFCEANEASIWAYLIEQGALFSSDTDWKRRLLLPAPFSKFRLPIDPQTPGRIGRWIGWQIVEKRMREGDLNVNDLIHYVDAKDLLRTSKYKP